MKRTRFTLVLGGVLFVALLAGCRRGMPGGTTPTPATSPVRVVSLAPSLTEIVCAVGAADCLVGRTTACNYPPEVVTNVPVVADFGRPFLEALAAQRPTLALEVDLEDPAVGAALARLGIERRHVPCERLDQIPGAIRAVGELVGRPAEAERLAAGIEAGIRQRRLAAAVVAPEQRPLVHAEIWGDPLMIAGRNSFVSELIALSGGRNLGDELASDYPTVSPEWVIGRNPDAILCLFHGAGHRARQMVMARTGWNGVRAVQTGRVYDGFGLDTILRPGPRVLEGADQLRRAVAPPAPAGAAAPPDGGAAVRAAGMARLRWYRILAGFIVGAALALSGAVLQALLRNPLAEPYVLGVSSGGAFGAALAILCGLAARHVLVVPAGAFLAALATLLVVYALASRSGAPSVYGLILSGVVVSAMLNSLLLLLISFASVQGLHTVTWWMLGSLQVTSGGLLLACGGCAAAAFAVMWLLARELNALTLGRDMAHHLGVRTGLVVALALGAATLAAAGAVALAGLIGFVGLIVPHAVRQVVGADHRRLLPAAAAAGGLFLVACDLAARLLFAPRELPVGVITALTGGPFFLVLLRRKHKAWME
jgi:iron complex transport system permease protein